ncbi:MAG: hypothetical protein JWL77_3523 [Chthonomonadaceae bacterium]|nr:hypothetical protein [Chthonomonadaceae bacterium]
MATVEKIAVFIACPGDVNDERAEARKVFDVINSTIGREKGITFDVTSWENDSFPAYGSDGQDIINEQIADMSQYDLFIGIMWNRLGFPTPRAESGTVEEFERAVKSFEQTGKPEIMFYFKTECYRPANAHEAEQMWKVMKFRESLYPRATPGDFGTTHDFHVRLHRHISQRFAVRNVRPPSPPTPLQESAEVAHTNEGIVQPSPPTHINSSGMWVMLNQKVFLARSIKDDSDGSIVVEIISSGAEDDVFIKSLRSESSQHRDLLLFALQNDGGLATVQLPTAIADASGKVWFVVLKPQDASPALFNEIAVNGYSADDIAAKRARLLLLNEPPWGHDRNSVDINDMLLSAAVRGLGGHIKVRGSVFPEIWDRFRDNDELFLPLARLWAIFNLKASGTVEHILELEMGPRTGNILHVKFRGQRHNKRGADDPYIIMFEGDCDLSSKPLLGEVVSEEGA